jgi:uncharacterized protein YdeI (YjbR/CyaY-like superfamily)
VLLARGIKELCALLFFKSALLEDPDGVLKEPGENTRSALRLEFRAVADVTSAARTIERLVQDAIRVEEAGLSAPSAPPRTTGLTSRNSRCCSTRTPLCAARVGPPHPGRRRGWLLHFRDAKQSKSRLARIERATRRILERFGIDD